MYETKMLIVICHEHWALLVYGLQGQENNMWLPIIENIFKRGGLIPMNFRVEPKNCYECFHMIPGHRNKKLFSMEIEILGFIILQAH